MDSQLRHDVTAALHLRESEVRLREAARALELEPTGRDDARRLYGLASRVRGERLELLARSGLEG